MKGQDAALSGHSPQSIFWGFQEFSGEVASDYPPNHHAARSPPFSRSGSEPGRTQSQPLHRPASLLADLIASASSAQLVAEQYLPDGRSPSRASPLPEPCACPGPGPSVPAQNRECCVLDGRGGGCDDSGPRGGHAERARPMDIPLNTYFRDPRQVRERQRLWAALVCYRLQQERMEVERQHSHPPCVHCMQQQVLRHEQEQ